ncbi:MAG: SCP2 sterol-binding domain-containing protein [Candidatus Bathyarchaeota archaeon]|nr:SCP2 sterol-binding domain-containing protein [Candidatus Termiticorpusculum sp.]
MEIQSAEEFFENTLPIKFKPEKAKDIEVIVQVNLLGDNPKDWVITIKNQKIHIFQGITTESAFVLKTEEKDFLEVVNGKISVEKAFFSGKINFKGDIVTALKLKNVGFL